MTKHAEFKAALQVFLELLKSEKSLFENDLDYVRNAIHNINETFKEYSWSAETQDASYEAYEKEAELVLYIARLEETDCREESISCIWKRWMKRISRIWKSSVAPFTITGE